MHRNPKLATGLAVLLVAVSATASLAQSEPSPATTPAPVVTPASPAKSATPAKTQTSATKSTKSSSTTKSASHTSSSAKHSSTPMLDINSASKEELAKIPAIGETLADKIVAARPYKSSKELVSKGVLTQKEYDKVHMHLTAKQPS